MSKEREEQYGVGISRLRESFYWGKTDQETRKAYYSKLTKGFLYGFVISAVILSVLMIGVMTLFYAKGLWLLNYVPYASQAMEPWVAEFLVLLLSVAIGLYNGFTQLNKVSAKEATDDKLRSITKMGYHLADEEGLDRNNTPGSTSFMTAKLGGRNKDALSSTDFFWGEDTSDSSTPASPQIPTPFQSEEENDSSSELGGLK